VERDYGARTILVLEENDIQLTNAQVVADAVLHLERAITEKPTEIYLVSTAVENRWWSWSLRIEGRDYYNLSQAYECLCEIDPSTLIDLTGR
jgi:predicted RNA polymerase sigma factor